MGLPAEVMGFRREEAACQIQWAKFYFLSLCSSCVQTGRAKCPRGRHGVSALPTGTLGSINTVNTYYPLVSSRTKPSRVRPCEPLLPPPPPVALIIRSLLSQDAPPSFSFYSQCKRRRSPEQGGSGSQGCEPGGSVVGVDRCGRPSAALTAAQKLLPPRRESPRFPSATAAAACSPLPPPARLLSGSPQPPCWVGMVNSGSAEGDPPSPPPSPGARGRAGSPALRLLPLPSAWACDRVSGSGGAHSSPGESWPGLMGPSRRG